MKHHDVIKFQSSTLQFDLISAGLALLASFVICGRGISATTNGPSRDIEASVCFLPAGATNESDYFTPERMWQMDFERMRRDAVADARPEVGPSGLGFEFSVPSPQVRSQPRIQLDLVSTQDLQRVLFVVRDGQSNILRHGQAFKVGGTTPDAGTLTFDEFERYVPTNYWRCFDIILTNGTNVITVFAVDGNGNLRSNSVVYRVDFGLDKTPPTLKLNLPDGNNFTAVDNYPLRGYVDEPGSVVTVYFTRAGRPNWIDSSTGRDGEFTLNLSLSEGENTIRVRAKDQAGNESAEEVLQVTKSPISITFNQIPPVQEGRSFDVSGSISDTNYAVWVNGVKGAVNVDREFRVRLYRVPKNGWMDIIAVPISDNNGDGRPQGPGHNPQSNHSIQIAR